jgi:hypothetical protein
MSRTPSEVSSDAYILIMQRPDGCGFATTSNDRRFHIDAMTVEPDVDLRPSELVLSEAMLGSKLSIDGQLSSPALSVTDMLHSRWVGASLRLLMGDWQQGSESSLLCEGELGPVHMEAGRLSMNCRPATEPIRKSAVRANQSGMPGRTWRSAMPYRHALPQQACQRHSSD